MRRRRQERAKSGVRPQRGMLGRPRPDSSMTARCRGLVFVHVDVLDLYGVVPVPSRFHGGTSGWTLPAASVALARRVCLPTSRAFHRKDQFCHW